ncbi:MAG TPA: sulfite exporter TauE/SafE family protein [Nitrososphaeraceae archaeon]|nr:sulfite exporter TauE/SafE family protein [Nitrososphaeraceae archaeon]
MEEFFLFPFFVIIGLIAGILGSMIGVGGGIIISPVLTFLGLTPPQVASTSLFAVSSTSVSSTIAYARSKKIRYMLGIKMALLSIPGAIIGSYFSTAIDPGYFKFLLAMILIGTGIYLMFRNSITNGNAFSLESIWIKILFFSGTFVAGIISSLFGIGGGVIFVPLMIMIVGLTMHLAAPTSQFVLMITSLVGLTTHMILGNPEYLPAILLSVGAFSGAQIGSRLSSRLSERKLRLILGFTFVGIAVRLILDFYQTI